MHNSKTTIKLTTTIAGACSLLMLLAVIVGCGDTAVRMNPVVFGGQTMGTFYTVKIVDRNAASDEQLAQAEGGVAALLKEINLQMSTYDTSSEISRFNKSQDTGWFQVSPDFAGVVDLSLRASHLSEGAFDITVGPLVNLWGFGPENVPQEVPSQVSIDAAMKNTGFDNLGVRLSPPALKKSGAEIYCDLAAVAKGHAVDRISAFLKSKGFPDHLVEIGGEIKAAGRHADGQPWRIGIKTPDSSDGIQKAITLDNRAMATSGDYMNYFERDGVRYSHLIDPRTGYPINHRLASVSVIDESCAYADIMATAINVLGPQDGYELAVRLNLAALLIVRQEGRFNDLYTPEFEMLLADNKP